MSQIIGICDKSTQLITILLSANKLVEAGDMEEVNEINVEDTLHQIQNNDSSLTHCIFNNVVSIWDFHRIVLNVCPTNLNTCCSLKHVLLTKTRVTN